jgi:hypothetical protein
VYEDPIYVLHVVLAKAGLKYSTATFLHIYCVHTYFVHMYTVIMYAEETITIQMAKVIDLYILG